MAAESDPEQVESLPLMPVRAAPNWGYGIDFTGLCAQTALQPEPPIRGHGMQVVDNLKPWRAGEPIDSGQVRQPLKLLNVVEMAANGEDPLWLDFQ